MSLRDFVDGLIDAKIKESINFNTPLINQSTSNTSQTFGCSISFMAQDGTATVIPDGGGDPIENVLVITSKAIGVGTRGILIAGSAFIS